MTRWFMVYTCRPYYRGRHVLAIFINVLMALLSDCLQACGNTLDLHSFQNLAKNCHSVVMTEGYVQTPDRAQLPDRTRFSVLWSFFLRYFILYAQLEEVYSIQNYFYLTPSFQYKKKKNGPNITPPIYI